MSEFPIQDLLDIGFIETVFERTLVAESQTMSAFILDQVFLILLFYRLWDWIEIVLRLCNLIVDILTVIDLEPDFG